MVAAQQLVQSCRIAEHASLMGGAHLPCAANPWPRTQMICHALLQLHPARVPLQMAQLQWLMHATFCGTP